MNPALWISKTGLDAQTKEIAVISNNLANASTIGFKKSRAVFEDLLYQNINQPSAYSRNGQFTMNDEGSIVTPGAGYLMQPQITVPEDALSIIVSQDGEVSVTLQGQAEPAVVGQINTVNFVNPTGLQPIGQNLYIETAVSGAPQEGVPGLAGYGMIVQGALETSNVNTTEELVNLIESQRVYEMNSKVISAVDEMLSYINQQL
jgi:flagellar basal-body rod protein FlgG